MGKLIIDRERIDILMRSAEIDTYVELAKRAQLHPNTLTKILKGEKWQSETVEKLASVLECNPIDLLVTVGFTLPNSVTLGSRCALMNQCSSAPGENTNRDRRLTSGDFFISNTNVSATILKVFDFCKTRAICLLTTKFSWCIICLSVSKFS